MVWVGSTCAEPLVLTVPTTGFMATVVAPETAQLRVTDWPKLIVPGLAEKELILGRLLVVPAASMRWKPLAIESNVGSSELKDSGRLVNMTDQVTLPFISNTFIDFVGNPFSV